MIAIICARSGSKRIPDKNILNFYGKPIIAYPLLTLKKNELISDIYVSTNSKKIKKISEKYGAKIPYLRSKKLSNDQASLKEVLKDFCTNVKFQEKFVCCVYPTAVLLENKIINKAYNKIKKLNYDLIVGIKEFQSNPEAVLKIKGNNLSFEKKNSYFKANHKTQYSDAGSFFIFNKDTYFKSNYIPKKTTFVILKSSKAVDVNNNSDLELLKALYKKNKN